MAPTMKQAPTVVQRPPMSAADKYKSYVRSNSNPIHQFDDNMKEPNNNHHDFENLIIKNEKALRGNTNSNTDAPQFFTCYTSYSCTPTGIPSVQTNQKIRETPQKTVQVGQGEQIRVCPNNKQLNTAENGKPGLNVQFNNVNNIQLATHSNPIKSVESSCHPSNMSQLDQITKLKNSECGNPAPNAQLINTKNTPRVPSPLIMINDATSQKPPRQRNPSGPILSDRPQGQYGLAHSSSSPAISSKGSSASSQNESLVLHYFQNSHTYNNLQERQLPGQGPIPKSMLPPPAPPADKNKSTSPCYGSKSNDLEKVYIGDQAQGKYGLAHSSSLPAISSKESPPSQNKSLVLQYFQKPHIHNNLQETQSPCQGPEPKSTLPPPAPPSARKKANYPCNSFNEKRRSLPNATMSGDGKSNDWEKVLTKLYHW